MFFLGEETVSYFPQEEAILAAWKPMDEWQARMELERVPAVWRRDENVTICQFYAGIDHCRLVFA